MHGVFRVYPWYAERFSSYGVLAGQLFIEERRRREAFVAVVRNAGAMSAPGIVSAESLRVRYSPELVVDALTTRDT